nr:RecName: Full=3-alpha-hydroxysteroid dehydrogenase/carbonyl reductase; Short=3-alpha-HSD; AltName: Full=3-alpha-hydroxysteroid dehydrogenase/3-oxosteroid reductase; AltName: Full=HSD29; AltName: Full=Hydroxyprostaglandin dehydrogenase [Pseudomonas sp.]
QVIAITGSASGIGAA